MKNGNFGGGGSEARFSPAIGLQGVFYTGCFVTVRQSGGGGLGGES